MALVNEDVKDMTIMKLSRNISNVKGVQSSKNLENKHNTELQRTDPGTKVTGEIIPLKCPKWIFIISIILVEKKDTKMIGHTNPCS